LVGVVAIRVSVIHQPVRIPVHRSDHDDPIIGAARVVAVVIFVVVVGGGGGLRRLGFGLKGYTG
jgi:hypothetical protein